MKKLNVLFLLCLLCSGLLFSTALAEDVPTVFYQGNTVAHPGDAIAIRGEFLDQQWTASITDGVKTQSIDLIQQNRQSFKFVVPEDFGQSLYTLTLSGDKPLTIAINTPVVRWMQGNHGDITTPNGWLRVQGECLRVAENASITLTLKGENGAETVLTPVKVYDDYSVEFNVGDLPHGAYAAAYSNGFATCDAGTLTIGESPMAKYADTVYNVLEYGLDNTGNTDCTAHMRALMQKIGDKGGVVYLPEGRYMFKSSFSIPKGVTLRGDGMNKTQIFWEDSWRSLGFDENNQLIWTPDRLPETMIVSAGDMVIEDIEFYASRIGEWLMIGDNNYNSSTASKVEGNVYIRNVRVYANPYLGVDSSREKLTESLYLGEATNHYTEHYREIMSINAEKNVQIVGCEFNWNGDKYFDENGYIEYFLFQDCTLDHSGTHPWFTVGADKGIIEDLRTDGFTWGASGDDIYFARNTICNTEGGDKEAFTTDGARAANYYGQVEISEDAMSYTFPKECDFSQVSTRCYVVILSGRGAGQARKIGSVNGYTVTIAEPFAVAPDKDSVITINFCFSNWYMVNMNFENAGRFQFYVANQNVVVDGATFRRTAGLKVNAQYTYNTHYINWYMSFVNCNFSDGNYYHVSGWSDYHPGRWQDGLYTSMGAPTTAGNYRRETIPGYGQLYLSSTTPDLGAIGITFRNNTLRDGYVLMIVSEYEGANHNISDAIIDSNHIENNDVGIYMHGEAEGLYMQDNTFTNVKIEMQKVKAWIGENDLEYYEEMWGQSNELALWQQEQALEKLNAETQKVAANAQSRPSRAKITYQNVPEGADNSNPAFYLDNGKAVSLEPLECAGFIGWKDENGNDITEIHCEDMRDRVITANIVPKPDRITAEHLSAPEDLFHFICTTNPEHNHTNLKWLFASAYPGWNKETRRYEYGIGAVIGLEDHTYVTRHVVLCYYVPEEDMWYPFANRDNPQNWKDGYTDIYIRCDE